MLRRVVWIGVLGLLGAWLVLVITINALIWSGALERWVSGKHRMSEVHLRVEHGYVVWPSRVHVRNFELEIDAYRYQLRVHVPEGHADVVLWRLAGRMFEARSIGGKGGTVMLLFKPEAADAKPARLRASPKIDGFAPPIRDPGVPNRPPFEKAWRVHLHDVEADLTQVWLQEFQVWGPGIHLQGSLEAIAAHRFGLPEMRIEFEDATLSTAKEPAAIRHLRGTLDLHIDEFNPFETERRAVLDLIQASVDVRADVETLAFAKTLIAPSSPLASLGGAATLAIEAGFDRGWVRAGSRLDLDAKAVRFHAAGLRWRSGVSAYAVAVPSPSAPVELIAEARTREVVAWGEGSKEPALRVPSLVASARILHAEPMTFELAGFVIHAPEIRVDHLSPWATASKEIQELAGRGRAELHAWYDGTRVHHRAELQVEGLRLGTSAVKLGGSGSFRAQGRTDGETYRTSFESLGGRFEGIDIATEHGKSADAWVEISRGSLSLSPKSGKVEARLHGRLDDLKPFMVHLGDRKRLLERKVDHDLTEPLHFTLAVERSPKVMCLDLVELARPTLHVRGRFCRFGKASRYAFLLERARIGILGQTSEDGDKVRKVETTVRPSWLAEHIAWVEAPHPKRRTARDGATPSRTAAKPP